MEPPLWSALLWSLSFVVINVIMIVVIYSDRASFVMSEREGKLYQVFNSLSPGEFKKITTFTEVPPIFMRGGSSFTAHPIAVGDYCLLIITERCYDRWYSGIDFAPPAEYRMHDYSDGFALVGIGNEAGLIDIPSVIQQTGNTNQDGDYTHQGNMNQTGDLTVTGDLQVNGDINCTGRITVGAATIGGIDFATHTHSGIQSGSGNTGAPNS
jgi:hypothetical protein